ncbi:MAG: hypothetical protein JWQ89_3190 [Devosia sp.]|uniref:hypothetical protein n=1 Tax=Devosia sp. TaxID=1871048 RepID=UPI0026094878|nr:hypothetical protein [Devosia sp.]MDB5541463.1 hypothetical protein [Devosia sp.]
MTTTPSLDQSRQAFEAWAQERDYPIERDGDGYRSAITDSFWVGWRAARERVEPSEAAKRLIAALQWSINNKAVWRSPIDEAGALQLTYSLFAALSSSAPSEAAEQEPRIPLGFKVTHCPDWSAMTDEANAKYRWHVERIIAPFCGDDDVRVWQGPTLADAMGKALAALKMGPAPLVLLGAAE